jgi:hypothetical protein
MKIQSTGNEKAISVRDERYVARHNAAARLIKLFSNPLVYLDKLFRILLYYIFRFDKWHISVLGEKRYAMEIIRYCNSLKRDKQVLEIGCGLGDILRNVESFRSFGYDRDVNALKAAVFLSLFRPGRVSFKSHVFPKDEITGKYDVIILVNWIHGIEPSVLRENLHSLFSFNLTTNGIIIIDTVHEERYMYNHNIDLLTDGIDCDLEKLGVFNHLREVWIIKKPAV